jgi:hypothetical protein
MILSSQIKSLVKVLHKRGYTQKPISSVELFDILKYFNLDPAGGVSIMKQLEAYEIFVEPVNAIPDDAHRNMIFITFNGAASERKYVNNIKTKLANCEPMLEPDMKESINFSEGNIEQPIRNPQHFVTELTELETKKFFAFEKYLKKFENGSLTSKYIYETLKTYYAIDLKKLIYDVYDITESLNIAVDKAGFETPEYREYIGRARRRKMNFEIFNEKQSVTESWDTIIYGQPGNRPFNEDLKGRFNNYLERRYRHDITGEEGQVL